MADASRHFLSQRRGVLGLVLMALGAACESDRVGSEPMEFPVTFIVTNNLVAPVTISVDGVPSLGLQSGSSSGLTVSSTAQWLVWMSANPLDARGDQVLDDIDDVQISLSRINGALEITNVIDDQTYITARIFNSTNAPVSIGVYNGSSVSCAAELPAASGALRGFTQIGYYKLLPATEVRAYRNPTGCGGSYVSWPSFQLQGFAPKSGFLTLSLDAAP